MVFKQLASLCFAALIIVPPLFAEDTGYTLTQERAKFPLLSPGLSEQKTAKIRLQNGLEALLISDPQAELSGAMLSVKAGSFQDPSGHPGLAHFLEHMLFLGTAKYPQESEYHRFISEHGGMANAFTTFSTTNYLFTVKSEKLPEALDRFSSFFKEPLLDASGVARELQAIDQEYAKNKESDSWRQLYVLKELAHSEHPFHNFNMGNSLSLANATRDKIEEWFSTYYSSNLMKLVIFSSLPLDQLIKETVSLFSGIPNKNLEPFTSSSLAFDHEQEHEIVYIEPIKDTRSLSLIWQLPPQFSYRKETKPDELVSFLLGHEGEKSLLAELKREELAEGISCSSAKLGEGFTLLYLEIELTEQGLSDTDQVIHRVFQAIKSYQKKAFPPYLFNEIQQMAVIEHQYQSKQNEFLALMQHAYQIQEEDLSTYPEHSKIIQQFNNDHIQELLSYLTPQHAKILVTAPSRLTLMLPTHQEKWLGVPYSKKPLAKEMLEKWKQAAPHEDIDFPAPNIFIPEHLQVLHTVEKKGSLIPTPLKIVDLPGMLLYFAKDETFGVPKIHWTIHILTPEITLTEPKKIPYGDIYVKEIKDKLSKISYPAKLAGLHYDITREDNGIKIVLEGYNHNAARLLQEILATISSYQPDESSFRMKKYALLREYQNFSKESPVDQSMEILQSLLYEQFVTEQQKAAAIRKSTYKKYKEFIDKLYQSTYIQAMLVGNMTEEESRSVGKSLQAAVGREPYPAKDHLKKKVIVLPAQSGPFYLECRTKSLGNAALLAIENDSFSFQERAAQQILMQAMKEPFFTSLRTKQQTGYLVHSTAEELERKLFNIFTVQSNTHDPRDLLSRFEQFIEGYMQEIGKDPAEQLQFDNIKSALMLQYSEPAKNISKLGALLSTLAFDYDGDFNWMEERIKGLDQLSYSDYLQKAKEFMGRKNKRRLAILLKGEIPEENEFRYNRARTWNVVRKASGYESRSIANYTDSE